MPTATTGNKKIRESLYRNFRSVGGTQKIKYQTRNPDKLYQVGHFRRFLLLVGAPHCTVWYREQLATLAVAAREHARSHVK